MKKIITILLLFFIAFKGLGQTVPYNPLSGQTFNLPYSQALQWPGDARSYYYDPTNFLWRKFQNVAEVLAYLPLPTNRAGNFFIFVDSGGVLQANGTYSPAGFTNVYMFKDSTANSNLVELNLFGGGGSGITGLTATSGSGINFNITNPSGPTANIGLTLAFGGDISGNVNAITVNKFNGQLPSFYQNYNNLFNTPSIPAQLNPTCVGCAISGAYPNLTWTVTGAGFNTAAYLLKAFSSSSVGVDTNALRYVDTIYSVNDSVFNFQTDQGNTYSVQLRGGHSGGGGGGSGTVTTVSVVTANGISGTVANPTSTPAITLTLGAIVPSTVNGLTFTALTNGFTVQGGTTPATLTVPSNATVSGTNTGNVSLSGLTYLTISGQAITENAVPLGSSVSGTLLAANFGALTGDVTNSAGSYATTISAGVVTYAKMQTLAAKSLIGNPTGSTATGQAVYIGGNLSYSNDTLYGIGGGTVTSVGLTSTTLGVTGSPITSSGTMTVNLVASGVTAGTYNTLTVNSNGIVTAGANLLDTLHVTFAGAGIQTGNASVTGDSIVLDRINAVNGLTSTKAADSSVAIVLGGALTQNTTINGGGTNEMIFTNFLPAAAAGFRVDLTNNGSDAGWDLFTRDSVTTFWKRIPKGTPYQVLTMLGSGGIGWAPGGSGGSGTPIGGDKANQYDSLGYFSGNNGLNSYNYTNVRWGYGLSNPQWTQDMDSTRSVSGSVWELHSDNITNYARLHIYDNASVFTIATESGGSIPSIPNMKLLANTMTLQGASATTLSIGNGTGMTGYTNLTRTISGTASTALLDLNGTNNMSAGTASYYNANPTISGTGSQGSTMYQADAFYNTVGSGNQLIYDWGNNTAANGAGTHKSFQNLNSTGVWQLNYMNQASTASYALMVGPDSNVYKMTTANLATLIGAGGSTLSRQNITSGSSATVTGGNYLVQFNFSSVAASFALTTPASPTDQQIVDIQTGTAIAAPNPEVTSFSIVANSGQTLNFAITPSSLNSGEVIRIRYNTTGAYWDRIL